MNRFFILAGFALMFYLIHAKGDLNKYINTKYAYLSVSAIVILSLLSVVEFVRYARHQSALEKSNGQAAHEYDHSQEQCCGHDHDHGHSHGESPAWKKAITYSILWFPIFTGIFLPVQTLDSSFVKAKGFSFPQFKTSPDNPGQHQFLKPDTSILYGPDGYDKARKKELSEFIDLPRDRS